MMSYSLFVSVLLVGCGDSALPTPSDAGTIEQQTATSSSIAEWEEMQRNAGQREAENENENENETENELDPDPGPPEMLLKADLWIAKSLSLSEFEETEHEGEALDTPSPDLTEKLMDEEGGLTTSAPPKMLLRNEFFSTSDDQHHSPLSRSHTEISPLTLRDDVDSTTFMPYKGWDTAAAREPVEQPEVQEDLVLTPALAGQLVLGGWVEVEATVDAKKFALLTWIFAETAPVEGELEAADFSSEQVALVTWFRNQAFLQELGVLTSEDSLTIQALRELYAARQTRTRARIETGRIVIVNGDVERARMYEVGRVDGTLVVLSGDEGDTRIKFRTEDFIEVELPGPDRPLRWFRRDDG